jgi:hypothetical protein
LLVEQENASKFGFVEQLKKTPNDETVSGIIEKDYALY